MLLSHVDASETADWLFSAAQARHRMMAHRKDKVTRNMSSNHGRPMARMLIQRRHKNLVLTEAIVLLVQARYFLQVAGLL